MRTSSGPSVRLAALPLLAVVLASCGGGPVKFEDTAVENAEEILAAADDIFEDVTATDVDRGTTTIDEESQCFFRQDGDDSVDSNLFCGPVRQLATKETDAWHTLPVVAIDADEGLILELVGAEVGELVSVDTDDLFRPDGADPIDVEALDEPQAPEAPAQDFAALVPRDDADLDAEFEALDEPYQLITTAATFTIEATATLDVVPKSVVDIAEAPGRDDENESEFEDESDQPSGTPFYRPAEGQQVRAWEVTIGSPPPMAAEQDGGFGNDGDPRDASAALALGVGSQRFSLVGDIGDDESGSVAISCESVPCADRDQKRYLLLASISEDAEPSLISTVDGADQAVALSDGTITSDVSQVAYNRESSTQQVSTTWGSRTILVRTEEQLQADQDCCYSENLTYEFGGEVQRVYLSPFDYSRGWAPAGKAWLVIPVMNDPRGENFGDVSVDWAKTWTLKVGDQVLPNEQNAGADDTAVFLVDEAFTAGTFAYGPAGSIKTGDKTYPMSTDDPLTLEVTFP